MQYLKELAQSKGYELRHYSKVISYDEQQKHIINVYNFCILHGTTYDGHKYYNDYYLIKTS